MALLTRFLTIDWQPLTFDELITVNLLSNSSLSFVLSWIRIHDTQLPLFYIIEHFVYHNIGHHVFWLRLPSFLFFCLGLLCACKYAKNKYNNEIASKLFVILSLSFPLLYFSAIIRPYSLIFFLTALCYYGHNKIRHHKLYHCLFVLSLIGLSLTHYFSALFALCFSLYYYQQHFRKKSFILSALTLIGLFTLFFGQDFLTDLFVTHLFRDPLTFRYFISSLSYLGGGSLICLFILIVAAVRYRTLANYKDYILLSLIMIVIVVSKSLLLSPSFEARYLIMLVLPLAIIVARLLHKNILVLFFILISLHHHFYQEAILAVPYKVDTYQAAQAAKKWRTESSQPQETMIASCDIEMSYYIENFNNCLSNCDLPNYVIEVRYKKNHVSCLMKDELAKDYTEQKKISLKNIDVILYQKKVKDN